MKFRSSARSWLGLIGLAAAATPECAEKSATVTTMTLRNWNIWHEVTANAHMKSIFNIDNPATGEAYLLRSMIFNEDGDFHACEPSDTGRLLSACEYRYDNSDSSVWFNIQWSCDTSYFAATLKAPLTLGSTDVEISVESLASVSKDGNVLEVLSGSESD